MIYPFYYEGMKDNELYFMIYGTPSKKAGDDVDYFVRAINNRVYLGFRGSESVKDWINDFNFPAKLYKNQKTSFYAHGGFGDTYKTANDVVMKNFIDICNKNPTYTPTIIGHSLGGAMAVFAMEDFYFRTGRKAELVTFGCPRVLWLKKSRDYFASCASSVKQYEINNDLVPRIPKIYTNINSVMLGDKYNWFKMMKNIVYYHTLYGDKGLY